MTETIGRYEIVRTLGEGGMGTVFEARHATTRKRCALKLLRREFAANAQIVERFLREARAPAEIGHPGIADVFDADRDAERGQVFLVMEYLEGEDLRTRLARKETGLADRLALFSAVLEPLAAAHAKAFVHRDLKPENVFVARERDGSERVKLLDFGIARQMTAERLTQTGLSMGTPHYMSPEQWRSAKASTPQTDVWAFGVMLYEALTGEVPFGGETAGDITVRVCTEPHVPLGTRRPELAPALSALVDRCLAKDPALRPADAPALLAEFRALAAQRPDLFASARFPASFGIADYSSGVIRTTAKPIPATAAPAAIAATSPAPVIVTPHHAGAFGAVTPQLGIQPTMPFATPMPTPAPTPAPAAFTPAPVGRVEPPAAKGGALFWIVGVVIVLVLLLLAGGVGASFYFVGQRTPGADQPIDGVAPPVAPPIVPPVIGPADPPSEPVHEGSLPAASILRVVDAHSGEIQHCYERALHTHPDLSGTVTVRAVISPTGAVSEAGLESSTLGNAAVEECITEAVGGWRFEAPRGGSVLATLPFELSPHGGRSRDPLEACQEAHTGGPLNQCIVDSVEPTDERTTRALALAYRTRRDVEGACRTMQLYVERYATGSVSEFQRYLARNCGTAGAAEAPSTGTESGAPPAGSDALPETPSRDSIRRAFASAMPELRRCAANRSGIVPLAVTFANTGRVTAVTVGGDLSGTREAECMTRVMRGVAVPPFQRGLFQVTYPVALRRDHAVTPMVDPPIYRPMAESPTYPGERPPDNPF